MARMVPDRLRPTQSRAEAWLYRKFERELPDEYTVVHGARWVGSRRDRRGEDGEADFVVLHPSKGILVLEAKSDEVQRDGPAGRWLRREGDALVPMAQDPVEQAVASKAVLRRLLEAMPLVSQRRVHLVHGIALPFQSVPPEGLGADAPRHRVLDVEATHDVERFVEGALASADPRRPELPDLGRDGVERVVAALAPRTAIPVRWGAVAGAVRERLVEVTEEQLDALEMIAAVPRATVHGGPGTGKTLLAAETARRFAAQGRSVLLLCFNAPLSGRLRTAVADVEGVTAAHFHAFCRRRGQEAGLADRIARAEGDPVGYERDFADVLYEAAARSRDRYDVLVVDEAQDLHEDWWLALEAWLADGAGGRVYAFADPTQDLYRRAGRIPLEGLAGPFPLRRNCRNPDEICAVLDALSGPEARLRRSGVLAGRRPGLAVVEGLGMPGAVDRTVARLLREERFAPSDVVVLTTHAQAKSGLTGATRLGGAPASWRERASADDVLVDTVHRYKGLESPAVVLAEVDPEGVRDLGTLVRVGVSRSQLRLEVLATPAGRAALAPALAAFDVAG